MMVGDEGAEEEAWQVEWVDLEESINRSCIMFSLVEAVAFIISAPFRLHPDSGANREDILQVSSPSAHASPAVHV